MLLKAHFRKREEAEEQIPRARECASERSEEETKRSATVTRHCIPLLSSRNLPRKQPDRAEMAGPAPQYPAPAGAASPQLLPAAGSPDPGLVPDDDMDPIQMEMMLQQAMYDLLQRPIIPDPLVFVCAALYLIVVMTLLITGAFYFTNRLQPPPPPTPPEETETTAKYTEAEEETTTDVKLWSIPNADNNPFVCLIGLQYKDDTAIVKQLIDIPCNVILMNDNIGLSNGKMTLQGKPYSEKEIGKSLLTEFAANIGDVAVGIECCSLVYNADFAEKIFDDGGMTSFSTDCKIKLPPKVNPTAATGLLDAFECSGSLYLDIGEASEQEAHRLAPVLSHGKLNYVLFAPTIMTTESLANLRMSLVPNNFKDLVRMGVFYYKISKANKTSPEIFYSSAYGQRERQYLHYSSLALL